MVNDICIPWPGVWLDEIRVESDTYIAKEGFGQRAHTYPVTIVQARYNGSYEGAPWLCFPLQPHHLGDERWRDWSGSDIECMEFWRTAVNDDWPIGRGESPGGAYDDLIAWACRRAGTERASLEAAPTWDREALQGRFPGDSPSP
jgi:hypothetical protein